MAKFIQSIMPTLAAAIASVLVGIAGAEAAIIHWDDGGSGIAWETNGNWSDDTNGLTSGDVAQFGNAGLAASGIDTSTLGQAWAIAGLQFRQNSTTEGHQLNLSGNDLSVEGDVRIADFSLLTSSHTARVAVLGDGDDVLQIGTAAARRVLAVGNYNSASTQLLTGELTLSEARLVGSLSDLLVGAGRRTSGVVAINAVGSGQGHSVSVGASRSGELSVGVFNQVVSSPGGTNTSFGSWSQSGGSFDTDVASIWVGHNVNGNSTATGTIDLANTSTSLEAASFGVGTVIPATGGNGNSTGVFQQAGGTFAAQIDSDLLVGYKPTPGLNSTSSGLLDLSGTDMTAGFTIGGDLKVGIGRKASGTVKFSTGTVDLTGNLVVGDDGSADDSPGGGGTGLDGGTALVELDGTVLLVGGSLAFGSQASDVRLLYHSVGFDPTSTYVRVPLAGKAALQALIDDGRLLGYVDGVQQDMHAAYTFAAYDDGHFAYAAYDAVVIPEPTGLTLLLIGGIVLCIAGARHRHWT